MPYPPPGMLGPRAIAWWAMRTRVASLEVRGAEHVPRDGPVLLVARHYHHLLDGAVLIRTIPRPVHVIVALDWTASRAQRRVMERACAFAAWPVVLRSPAADSAYAGDEVARYVRRGLRDAARLLADGRVVAIFPEGRPAIDPAARAPRAHDADEFLPFARGFTTIARLARSAGARDVAIVPVGFRYERDGTRWHVRVRYGEALPHDAGAGDAERAVRHLSR